MIKSLGPGLDSLDFLRIALGNQHLFIVIQNSNLSKPLVLTWPQLLKQIQDQLNIVAGGVTSVNGQTGVVYLALDDLTDVNTGTPTNGQFLQWNGTEWVAVTISPSGITSVNGDTGPAVVLNLDNINDVNASSPSTNQILQFDGTEWVAATITGNTYTADNGLTMLSNNVALGSASSPGAPLLNNRYIDTGATYTLNLKGQKTNQSDVILLVDNTASGGTAIKAQGTGSSVAISASSGNSYAIIATSNTLVGLYAQTSATGQGAVLAEVLSSASNLIALGLKIRHSTSGTPVAGFGISTDFMGGTNGFAERSFGRLRYQWTDAVDATRTSKFQVETVDNATPSVNLEVLGSGQLILNKYTTSTSFGGLTSVGVLNVDNTGKVFVGPGGGGRLNEITGILFGGVLTATIGGTTFDLTAGIGQIVTQTASITGVATTISNVTWSTVTAVPITNIGTSQFTYILVDSSGTVIQQTTPFTDAQYKTHIIIGVLCHINLASVNLVTNAQNVAYEDPHRLVELISAFGPIKKTGLNIGANGANLRVNRTSGEAFKIGSNYITDQFEPDVDSIPAQIPALLCRVHRNGSGGFVFDTNGGSYYNDIDPNQYDDGSGVLQSVGGSKWTIQRLFFFPNNPVDIICYYGTQTYNQFSEARANLEFETFDEATITAENAIFLGFLFVKNAATDLSLPTQAAFLQSGLFRGIPPGGGGSGGGGNSIGQLTGDVDTVLATSPTQVMPSTLKANLKTGSCGVTFDGGGQVVQNKTAYVQMPYNGTLGAWSMVADVAGACTISVYKGTFGTFPPSSAVYSTQPAIPATNITSSNAGAYNPGMATVTAGDVLKFDISGVSTITWVNLSISIAKT